MIRNLNEISFQEFGTVLSSRTGRSKPRERITTNTYTLRLSDASLYRGKREVRLWDGTGLAVLSVSLDGEKFHHFYLDKPVAVKRGVIFSVNPFINEASITVSYAQVPEFVGSRSMESLRVVHQHWAEGIYSFISKDLEMGFLYPGEIHSEPELMYVESGSLHCVVEGKDVFLRQGELVLFGPNQWHMVYADIGVAPRVVTISFDIGHVDMTPLLNYRFCTDPSLQRLIRQMLLEQERMDTFSKDIILSELNLLLLHLLRIAGKAVSETLQDAALLGGERRIICKAQQYICANVEQKLSVPVVAQHVDVSPSYLTALFHKNLHIAPGEYIRRVKLQQSKELIRDGNLNFTEIASRLQYSTVHHFSRQFKEKFGITPTEYEKIHHP